jgi:hypothetical protein
MTKTLSMVSHKNYNLNAKWGFCHFLTSKLSTCFIDGFTSRRKSQSIACLLNGSEHIYWILDLETEVHSIWVIWTQCSATGQSYRARKLPAGVGRGENQASSLARRSRLILPYRGFSVLPLFKTKTRAGATWCGQLPLLHSDSMLKLSTLLDLTWVWSNNQSCTQSWKCHIS